MVLGKKNIYAEGTVSRNRYPYLSGKVKRTNRDFLEFVSNRTEELKTLELAAVPAACLGRPGSTRRAGTAVTLLAWAGPVAMWTPS